MERTPNNLGRKAVRCLISKSVVQLHIGMTGEAMESIQQGMALATGFGDRGLAVECLGQLNDIYNTRSKFGDMARTAQLCLEMCRSTGNLGGMATSHNYLGIACDSFGQYRKAIEHYSKAAELHRKVGNLESYISSLENIGVANYSLGNFDEAERHYLEALEVAGRHGSLRAKGLIKQCLASVKLMRGEYGKALVLLTESLAINEAIGDRGNKAYTLHEIGCAHDALGSRGQALCYLEESERIKEEMGDQWGQAASINRIARVLIDSGRLDEAARWLEKGEAIAVGVGNPDIFCRLAVARGMLALAKGETDGAVAAKDRAIDQANKAMLKAGRAEALLLWARIDDARGFNGSAEGRYREARELFAGMNSRFDLGIVDYYRGMNRRSAGRESEAAALLGASIESFRSVGAAGWLRRAEEALREPEKRTEPGESR